MNKKRLGFSLSMFLGDFFKGIPWDVVIAAYAIIGLGLLNLYSVAAAEMYKERFSDQLMWVAIGTGLLILIAAIPMRIYNSSFVWVGYAFLIALLLYVKFFGKVILGARRWIFIGSTQLQPSEFAKFGIIIILAYSISRIKHVKDNLNLFQLWPQALLIALPAVLILTQPDAGTAGLVCFIAMFMLFFVRINLIQISISGIFLVLGALIYYFFFAHDYQKNRILTFLNPTSDMKNTGYQVVQSIIAIGSGGLWGKGFMHGTQGQLDFLPERHTDFIFSVWAEEHGFVGSVLLLGIYGFMLIRMLYAVEKAPNVFCSLLCAGVAGYFLGHALINILMVIGLFPVVGVPLSLVSYGGTHMLTSLCCLGLFVAAERYRYFVQER